MAYTRAIPSYDLYGDQASVTWSNLFNFEWIPQRSGPYQWVIQVHRHEAFLQVLHLTSGRVVVQIDEQQIEAAAPCVLVIPAGHVHGFRFSPDTDGPVVTAPQKGLESLAQAVMPELIDTIRRPQVIALQADMRYVDQLMPLFLALEQECRSQAPGQITAGLAVLMALMVQVHRLGGLGEHGAGAAYRSASRKARQIEKFRALVDRHFRSHRPLSSYAQEIGVTVGQLSRLCREVLGMSSLDVINARLLHEAQRELVYTGLPIKQLAAELGFEDDAYFSRFFRKHTGQTPRDYRARALEAMGGQAGAGALPAGH